MHISGYPHGHHPRMLGNVGMSEFGHDPLLDRNTGISPKWPFDDGSNELLDATSPGSSGCLVYVSHEVTTYPSRFVAAPTRGRRPT